MKGFEIIKAVHLDPVPFDMERDLLTPTYKKKRPQLQKYYQVIQNLNLRIEHLIRVKMYWHLVLTRFLRYLTGCYR